jgi:AcrR family transcriptional regulator
MRPLKVENQLVINGLMSVFMTKGYDGASLNDLAEASGLKKASLYHRFPEGKKEIAAAVLTYVNEWIGENIYALLTNTSILPRERLKKALENIDILYNKGENSCIIRAMSLDAGLEIFGEQVKETLQLWIDGFTELGSALGFSKEIATEKALQTLITIQGSLVVSKAWGATTAFQLALKTIEKNYLNG